METNNFSYRVKKLREEKEITGTQLSAMFNQTKSAVSSWERRGRQPSHEVLIKLANYFGVTVDYLIGKSNNRSGEFRVVTPEVKKEIEGFAVKLVKQLIESNTIKSIDDIDDPMIAMIKATLYADIVNKKKD